MTGRFVSVDSTTKRISTELERKMDEAIARYPADRKRSAAMPLLHLWQEEFGFISDEGVNWIASKLELQPINILELVTFYPDVPAGASGEDPHPYLPNLELRDGGQLRRHGTRLRCGRHRPPPGRQRDAPPDLGEQGWQIQHRVRRMPGQLRDGAGLHGSG